MVEPCTPHATMRINTVHFHSQAAVAPRHELKTRLCAGRCCCPSASPPLLSQGVLLPAWAALAVV